MKVWAREAGITAQVAGGVPARCDGVTQGYPGIGLPGVCAGVLQHPVAIGSDDAFVGFAPFDPRLFERVEPIVEMLAVGPHSFRKIGRAHVCTPVTNAHLVCRLLLEKKKVYLSAIFDDSYYYSIDSC